MERIDFEKYDLHGDELLIAAAVAGLYAMEVDRQFYPWLQTILSPIPRHYLRFHSHIFGCKQYYLRLQSDYPCFQTNQSSVTDNSIPTFKQSYLRFQKPYLCFQTAHP